MEWWQGPSAPISQDPKPRKGEREREDDEKEKSAGRHKAQGYAAAGVLEVAQFYCVSA